MSLKRQVLQHAALRVISGALSFGFFGVIASRLSDGDAQDALFFMFAQGFFIATLRLFAHLASGIDGESNRRERYGSLIQGLRLVWPVVMVMSPFVAGVAWLHSGSLMLALAAAFVCATATPDADLTRAIAGRPAQFPAAFASGTAIGLVGVSLTPELSVTAACAWILVQWLPVCGLNMAVFCRTLRTGLDGMRRKFPSRMISVLALSVFDGVVLNLPFLGIAKTDSQAAMDLSVAMRVFVASIPFHSLLLHWANFDAISRLSSTLRLSPMLSFGAILIATGTAIAPVYFVAYEWLTGRDESVSVLSLSLTLLFSYGVYASLLRFRGPLLSDYRRLVSVLLPSAFYVVFFQTAYLGFSGGAWVIVALQSSTLLFAAALIWVSGSRVRSKR